MDAQPNREDASSYTAMNLVTRTEALSASSASLTSSKLTTLSSTVSASSPMHSSYGKLRALTTRLRQDRELKRVVEGPSFSSGGDFISLNEQNSKKLEMNSNPTGSCSVVSDALCQLDASMSSASFVETLRQSQMIIGQSEKEKAPVTEPSGTNQLCSSKTVTDSNPSIKSTESTERLVVSDTSLLQNKDLSGHVPCCIAEISLSCASNPRGNVLCTTSQGILPSNCSIVNSGDNKNVSNKTTVDQPRQTIIKPGLSFENTAARINISSTVTSAIFPKKSISLTGISMKTSPVLSSFVCNDDQPCSTVSQNSSGRSIVSSAATDGAVSGRSVSSLNIDGATAATSTSVPAKVSGRLAYATIFHQRVPINENASSVTKHIPGIDSKVAHNIIALPTQVSPKAPSAALSKASSITLSKASSLPLASKKVSTPSSVATTIFSSRYSLIKKTSPSVNYTLSYSSQRGRGYYTGRQGKGYSGGRQRRDYSAVRQVRGYYVGPLGRGYSSGSLGRGYSGNRGYDGKNTAGFCSPVFTSRHALARTQRPGALFAGGRYSYNRLAAGFFNKTDTWYSTCACKKLEKDVTNINIRGGKVTNLCRNRYKFIRASAAVDPASTATTARRRKLSLTRKSRFSIDKRQLFHSARSPWRYVAPGVARTPGVSRATGVARTPQQRRLSSSSSTSQSAQQLSSKYKLRRRSGSSVSALDKVKRGSKITEKQYCIFYGRFGRCNRGDKCLYVHDPDKVSVCTRFLRGTCNIEDCPFSHTVRRERMPTCRHFLKGVCLRGSDCPYLHVNVGADAAVCEKFLQGNCPDGEMCKKRHELLCPDYLKSGSCPRGDQCLMKHWRRANKRPTNRGSKTSAVLGRERITIGMSSENIQGTVDSKAAAGKHRKEIEDDDVNQPWNLRRMPSYISINSPPSRLSEQEASAAEKSVQHSLTDLSHRAVRRDIHPRIGSLVDNQVNQLLKSYLDTIIPTTDKSFDQSF